jgi:hypothetical protein
MNIVLYTMDMEPITIIDLPMWAIELGEKERMVAVAVIRPPSRTPFENTPLELSTQVVYLRFHPLVFYGKKNWIITVENEELALLLKPSWLPGQRKQINDYERQVENLSFALLQALSALAGKGGH